MALNFNHNTPAQIAAQFWQRLRDVRVRVEAAAPGSPARREAAVEFARMVWKLYGHVQAGDFTSNEVRLSFNAAYNRSLTAGQWTTFVQDTLKPIRDRYQAMLDQADL